MSLAADPHLYFPGIRGTGVPFFRTFGWANQEGRCIPQDLTRYEVLVHVLVPLFDLFFDFEGQKRAFWPFFTSRDHT